jgi:hypothetical protein
MAWKPLDLIFARTQARLELLYLQFRHDMGLPPPIVRWLPRKFR